MRESNELFTLCKEVYERVAEWGDIRIAQLKAQQEEV